MNKVRWASVWVSVGAVLTLIAPPDASAALSGPVPFSEGEVIEGAWEISGLKRHPEFLRLVLTKDGIRGHLEIVASDAAGPWSTRHYRVQPAPGLEAPIPALKAMLRALKALESQESHRPFLGSTPSAPDTAESSASRGPPAPELRSLARRAWPPKDRWLWLILSAIALITMLSCVHQSSAQKGGLAWSALALGAGVIAALTIDATALPAQWITVLQEGSVASIIGTIHGEGHHGPAYDALIWAFGDAQGLRIRDMVRTNLILAIINTIGVAGLTWALTRRTSLSILSAAAWGLAPLQVNAAWSDLPATLIHTYTLMGATALGCMARTPKRALLLLGLISALLAGVRLEWGALGALTWGSVAVARLLSDSQRQKLNRGLLSVTFIVTGLVLISAIGVVGEGTSARAPEAWQLWQKQGGGAAGWGIVTWPLGFLAAWPLGLVILALIGGAAMLIRPLTWSAAASAALLLQGVYWTSAHGGDAPYEVLRYATLMSGLGALCTALGWHVVLAQVASFKRAQPIVLGLAALCLVPLPDGLFRNALEPHHQRSAGPLYEMPLSRHQQAEARALIAAHEAYPSCVIATVSAIEPSAERTVSAYEYIFFGGALVTPLVTKRRPEDFSAIIDALATEDGCILVHRGLDCHIAGGPDCREEVGGATFIEGVERLERPYYDHVFRREPLRLELWKRRGALPENHL